MIAHWDDVRAVHRESGHISGHWQSLTGEASDWVGVQRIRIDPGMWSTPLHLEGADEEIFFVISGTGISVQGDGSAERAFAVGAGDCLVHLALVHAHTLQAGPEGLEVLAFGERQCCCISWMHAHRAGGVDLAPGRAAENLVGVVTAALTGHQHERVIRGRIGFLRQCLPLLQHFRDLQINAPVRILDQ